MCGLLGIIASGGSNPAIDGITGRRLRDRMAHRGPDDAGEWSDGSAWIGHRRLSIMDPSGGHEPFVIDDGGGDPCIVVFNGELLEHRSLRADLEAEGGVFRSSCDAETAAVAVAFRGPEALDSFRGMFALAWYRPARRRLWIARDAFGVVPLLHGVDRDGRVVFSSEMRAMIDHLGPAAGPDIATIGAYLSTIRLTLGDRTLVEGVRQVRPGHVVEFDLSADRPQWESRAWWTAPSPTGELSGADADRAMAEAIEDSLAAHLQSDVEVCSLLSGGLDSAVLTTLAIDRHSRWRTFTAIGGNGSEDPDRAAARILTEHLGRETTEVSVVDAVESPLNRWNRMVASLGVPLGTPNEIAINALAEAVRDAGVKVAISGEGADELLGGYEPVLRIVSGVAATAPSPEAAAAMLLESIAWMSPTRQEAILSSSWVEALGPQEALIRETAAAIESGGPADEPRSYLRWLQTVNLSGLLGRLNHACMLASVEARPPFADRRVAEVVSRIRTEDLFNVTGSDVGASDTKIALRRAFRHRLPEAVVSRPKASFPMPFAPWASEQLGREDVLVALRPLLAEPVWEAISSTLSAGEPVDPMLAWPLANLGLWSVSTGVGLRP
ncbi:MAG: asparagine synthase (glutamine-hydrolyzing) [Phycisphaerae bacterium]|nr:asparagine synthase (glutamine-hydrolyzing) [Phycisphaerae bacterium]